MIALSNDHAGLTLKGDMAALLEEMGLPWKDLGVNSPESVDYPILGRRAAEGVASGEYERGILLCGTGVGMALSANKVRGIRCVVCSDCYTAKLSRLHNDANILALGARVVGPDLARMIARIWLETPFEGGRHARRVEMIMNIERDSSRAAGPG